MDNTQDQPGIAEIAPVAVILSGPRRGHSEKLTRKTIRIVTTAGAAPRFVSPDEQKPEDYHATLHRIANTYEIAVAPGREIWINGERVTGSRVLKSGDLLEIGHGGPVVRYRIYPGSAVPAKTISEAVVDSMNGAQAEGHSRFDRTSRFLVNILWNLATQTTLRFRLWILIILTVLIVSVVVLTVQNLQLQKQVVSEGVRIEEVERLMQDYGSTRLSHQDLLELQEGLRTQLADAYERLAALEAGSEKAARVIATATPSVVLLLGSFGFVDPYTGEFLHIVESENRITRFTMGGEGKVMELAFTGTGFVVSENGLILTNHHIIEFPQGDPRTAFMQGRQLTPVVLQIVAYFPSIHDPVFVEIAATSEQRDLLLLRPIRDLPGLVPIEIEEQTSRAGDEVLLLGYPLGINALVARASAEMLESITKEGLADFWTVAHGLSRAGYIKPLATRGIVGQVTDDFLVYDAETTFGGSGGPVLNLNGRVTAINSSIIPEFGGSNMGILARHARDFLTEFRARGSEGQGADINHQKQ